MSADLRWLRNAEQWGAWVRFDEVTGDRESIWLLKSRGEVLAGGAVRPS